MSQNGKGSKPRPYSVKYSQYCENWEVIFNKNKTKDQNDNDRHKIQKRHTKNS
jgi:hypothetical protein